MTAAERQPPGAPTLLQRRLAERERQRRELHRAAAERLRANAA